MRRTFSYSAARNVEDYYFKLGCDGGSCGGDEDSLLAQDLAGGLRDGKT
jgi:hypothetical protein